MQYGYSSSRYPSQAPTARTRWWAPRDPTTSTDSLYGGKGNDSLVAGDGDDVLVPDEDNDVAFGGAGNDTFAGGRGTDVLSGGAGDDLFALNSVQAGIITTMSGGDGADRYLLYAGTFDQQLAVTDFAAGAGGDVIDPLQFVIEEGQYYGYAGGNPFRVDVGFLRFLQAGADTHLQWDPDGTGQAYGWFDLMVLLGTDASSLVTANVAGGIPLDGSDAPGVLVASAPSGTAGTFFDDTLVGTSGDSTLDGRGGDDWIDGGAGHDWLTGGNGDDTLLGGDGSDALYPGHGSNDVDGGEGADMVTIGSMFLYPLRPATPGTTTAIGGAGGDRFVLNGASTTGVNEIADFTPGADTLDVSMLLLRSTDYGGQAPFLPANGYLRFAQQGADALLQWDPDGAAGIRYGWISAATLRNVQAASLAAGDVPDADFALNAPVTSFVGTEGDDTLTGAAGANLLRGGGGNDTYHVDDPNESVEEWVGAGSADAVFAACSFVLRDNVENLTLTDAAGAASAGGNAWDNRVTGNASANLLQGFTGADTFRGGGGDDTFFGGEGTDTLVLDAPLAALTSAVRPETDWLVTVGADHLTFRGMQRVQFEDALFALDTFRGQPVMHAFELLWAIGGEAPGIAVLSEWVAVADEQGVDALPREMLKGLLPGIGTGQLIQALFDSLLGRPASAGEQQEFENLVGPGRMFGDDAALFAFAAGHALNTSRTTGLVGSPMQLDPAYF
jgi:Ca2+-binding RTX toxin-like protein